MNKKIRRVVIAGVLSGLLGSGCSTNTTSSISQEDRADMYLNLAVGALREGDSTGALQSVMTAEQLGLQSTELFHTKALAYYYKRDLNSALVAAQKAVDLSPGFSQANNTLGKILMDLGQPEKSIPHLSKAAKDPINREAYKARTSLGMLYYRKNDLHLALEQFEIAIRDEPKSACLAYYYRGHLKVKNTQTEDAIQDYKKAIRPECGPFEDAHFALGLAFENNHQPELARQKFLEIQRLFPGSKSAEHAMLRLRNLP
jgi:Tfp pilus assembly protein PilF